MPLIVIKGIFSQGPYQVQITLGGDQIGNGFGVERGIFNNFHALFRLKLITDRPEEILPFLNIRIGFNSFGGKTVDDA